MKVFFKNELVCGHSSPRFYSVYDDIALISGVRHLLAITLSELGLVDLNKECSLELEVSQKRPRCKHGFSVVLETKCLCEEDVVYAYTSENGASKEFPFCYEGLSRMFGCIPDKIYVSFP